MTRRKLVNNIMLALCVVCAIFGVGVLLFIMGVVVYKGIGSMGWDIFFKDTSSPFENGGLRNAIVGQIILSVGAGIIGVPLGILAGTFLREYADGKFISKAIRNCSDILSSIPSIVIATFIYAVVVVPMGHFSGWAGILALAIIMVPIILKVTDDSLSLIPNTLRESAIALGATKSKMITQILYRGAKNTILTGILLGFCRIIGESAPLLFTSLNNSFFTLNLNSAFPSLSVTMFNYAQSPYSSYQELGWCAALLLSGFILSLNILSRIIQRRSK